MNHVWLGVGIILLIAVTAHFLFGTHHIARFGGLFTGAKTKAVGLWIWKKKGVILFLLILSPLIWFALGLGGQLWVALWKLGDKPHHPVVVVNPPPRNENQNREKFFVETPRKLGWKTLPLHVDVQVPLDGVPRYIGLNTAFLHGSQLRVLCPTYYSGGNVKLWMKADDPKFVHLGHEMSFSLKESGSVTGGGAVLVKGEKSRNYSGASSQVIVDATPRPGFVRIATTKECKTGFGYNWGTVQVGKRADSPPWQVYIRFAYKDGTTIPNDVMQQKPGQIMIGVQENGKFRPVLEEIVSKPANLYGSYSIRSDESDLFLRIQPPNVPEKVVNVDVILNLDTTRQ